MGIANHAVRVVKINELIPHPNADTLSIIKIEGYQVVVKTVNYPIGTLAIFIPPDSVVPQRFQFQFLWENMTFPDGIVPEKKRRITARRFRKEWSEGLLMPLAEFLEDFITDEFGRMRPFTPCVGDDLSGILDIYHYEPPEEPESTKGNNERGPGSKQNKFWPRSLKGWLYFIPRILTFGLWDPNGPVGGNNEKSPEAFRPIYDVEALKNYADVLQEGEEVVVTEKIHGSNARYTFSDGKMYAGSRKLWKSPSSKCIWRTVLEQHPWIESWCKLHPNFTLYGEVVPTQRGYDYGCKDGQTKFFVFDILSPDGTWVDFYGDPALQIDGPIQEHKVPLVADYPYTDAMKALAEGPSTVDGAKHIREGIVIRPVVEREVRNLGRVQLKVVSNRFLEAETK